MDKVDIDVLNTLNNEELLDLYNQVNDHITYLNENIIKEEDNKEESTDNNG
jgi:hypothetical protein